MRRPPLSRPARWRITTLVLVHVLIAVHIIHWRMAGVSLSSIQLSDAGRFSSEGVATAAAIFFASLLLVTAVFGRFFCAWGCHMLAMQELCRFVLRRCGLTPKLIRSRALAVVPFAAGFYVFILPLVQRLWDGQAFPLVRWELTSAHLWTNLPKVPDGIAAVLIGGLGMIYFLGRLSFCKYVCPYGALFVVADHLAVGRIRLTGECDNCARCTAACTTGVRVHEEVQRLGMVASSGCMRCLECVSACERDVLHYRLGAPSLLAGSRVGLVRYAFSLVEEGVVLGLFGLGFIAFNGLYDFVPLLLALCIAALLAYGGIIAVRLIRQPLVAIHGRVLKASGGLSRAGVAFACCAGLLFALSAHSLLIRYHSWRADAALVIAGFPRAPEVAARTNTAVLRDATAHLVFCTNFALVDTVAWNMKLAWLARASGESGQVETYLRRAIALDASRPEPYFNLGKELLRQGRRREATSAFDQAVHLAPALAQAVPAGFQPVAHVTDP